LPLNPIAVSKDLLPEKNPVKKRVKVISFPIGALPLLADASASQKIAAPHRVFAVWNVMFYL
jgi:hypothetical protein